MSALDADQEKTHQEQEWIIKQQIAFASGIFQADITIRTLLESLAEGVIVIDNSGTVLLVNTRAEQMFGYSEKALIGKPHAVLIPDRFRKVHEEHVAHFFAEPKIRPMGMLLDLAGLRRDGSEFPLEISLSFLETINGILVMAFVSDITLRKQYESHLRETEELFHIQVEGVKDYAIFMLDTQGHVLNWNAGAERLKGYKEEEIIGKHYSCFYSEEDRNAGKPEEVLKKADAEGRVVDEGWRIRKDGSRFWADVIITALYNESGYLRGFSKVTRDITMRKRAIDTLRFSEARYRTLFQDNPTMIFTIDTDWIVLSANPFSASQLGYTIDELEGQSILKIFHGDDRPAVIEQFHICLQNPDQIYRWQFRKVRKDGELLWVEETAQAIYDLKGALNVLVVCQDITARKRVEEEREQLLLQFESVLENINEGVVISDLKGNILTMNKAALALHEYENIEQARRPLSEYPDIFELSDLDGRLVPFEEWPLVRAINDIRFVDIEVRVSNKGTGKSWIGSFSGSPVRSRSGGFILAVTTIRDITERKRTEAEIQRLASFPIINPNPILEFDLNGQMTFCNPAAKQILENAGYYITGVNPLIPQDMPGIIQDLHDKETGHFIREIRIDGQLFEEIIYIAKPFKLVRIYSMDITERNRMEEELVRMYVDQAALVTELSVANQDLETFNYTVAHDLRQPLHVVGMYCQTIMELCENSLNEECNGYLQGCYEGILRMNRLIDALLDFSRIGHLEPHRKMVNLSALTKELVLALKVSEPERHVDFLVKDGVAANADENLLRIVLDNLLGNAWKYTNNRENALIEFGETEIDGVPVLFVRDNGAGFDNTHAADLFSAFKRLPGAEEFKGFGIGLATVERIIQRHGGKIWAEGALDKGATFYFTTSPDPASA